jgi:hypothetical protein
MLHFNARVDDENFLLLHFLQLTLYAMAWNCRNWMNRSQNSQSCWNSGRDWNRKSCQSDVGRDRRCQMDFQTAAMVLKIVWLNSLEIALQHNRDLYRVKFYLFLHFLWSIFEKVTWVNHSLT